MIKSIKFKQKSLRYKTIHNSKHGGNVDFWDKHFIDLIKMQENYYVQAS